MMYSGAGNSSNNNNNGISGLMSISGFGANGQL